MDDDDLPLPPPLLLLALAAAEADQGAAGPAPAGVFRRRPGDQPPLNRAETWKDENPRLRRFHELLSEFFNSCYEQGFISRTTRDGLTVWRISQRAWTAPRDPVVTDDRTTGVEVGHLWVNQENQTAFLCVSETENAAVWKKLVFEE